MTLRGFHHIVAMAAFPLLTVTALTGLVFRVGRQWFGMSDETGAIIRAIHEGRYLGAHLSPVYVLLVGVGLLLLICSGLTMMRVRFHRAGRPPRRNMRWFHRTVAILFVVPLTLTPLTGIGFRLTQSWLGWPKQRAQWLLDLHQGTYFFGKDYRVYYVLFIGVGLLTLIATGVRLLGLFPRRRPC